MQCENGRDKYIFINKYKVQWKISLFLWYLVSDSGLVWTLVSMQFRFQMLWAIMIKLYRKLLKIGAISSLISSYVDTCGEG